MHQIGRIAAIAAILAGFSGAALAQSNVITLPNTSSQTSLSGTVATGGTFQLLQAAQGGSTARRAIEIYNVCQASGACTATSNNCYFAYSATQPANKLDALQLPPGGYYLRSSGSVPQDAIWITCDGNGDHFTAKVQ